MHLTLQRPVAFFDLETTGLNISKDRIVEIAIVKICPDQTETTYHQRLHPGMPIPAESTEVHGISDEDVKDCPTFEAVAHDIKDFIGDADLAGYNSNKFDVPFLIEQFLSCEVDFSMEGRRCIDVQTIFHKMEQRTLCAAVRFYCHSELEGAHSALADARATYDVLKAQIDMYEEIENDVDFLETFTRVGKHKVIDFVGRLALNEQQEIVYNFGKHSGKTLKEVFETEPGYHRWILDNDFPLYTKKIIHRHIQQLTDQNRKKRLRKKGQRDSKMADKIEQLKHKFNAKS